MIKLGDAGYLASAFSPPFVRELSRPRGQEALREVVELTGLVEVARRTKTIGGIFNFIYQSLRRVYRCEYLYKNAIASQILLERYSPKTAVLHSELQVGDSRADVVLVNGTTLVYEIKTELDSLNRLDAQLRSYQTVFDRVYVVTHAGSAESLSSALPDGVGLLALSPKGLLTETRIAESNSNRILPEMIFNMLRRHEYIDILSRHLIPIPDVPNTMIYRACRELFMELSRETVHAEFVRVLLARGRKRESLCNTQAPHSLRFHALTGNLGPDQNSFLKQPADNLFK
jgi:hypothetical protein